MNKKYRLKFFKQHFNISGIWLILMTLDETLTGLKSLILINTSCFLFVKEIKRTLIGMFAFVYNKRQEIKKKIQIFKLFRWVAKLHSNDTTKNCDCTFFFVCVSYNLK